MGTNTRPELSTRNRWWISKHRYLELRHFCLQYAEWRQELNRIDSLPKVSTIRRAPVESGLTDPTWNAVEQRDRLIERMKLIESAAYEASEHQEWYTALVKAVSEGISYDLLEVQFGYMPISRGEWYEVYRRFFWVLDKTRK